MEKQVRCKKCGKLNYESVGFCTNCGVSLLSRAVAIEDPYLGKTIDNIFVVESILGEGSMGVVYRARHRGVNRLVALKILRHDLLSDRNILMRFQREVQAASFLNHPNVIKILHNGNTFLNAPYIAMECLEGADLSELVVRDFPMPALRVANILLQVCRALEAAHAAKIIHRDLKPANIIVTSVNGQDLVKVLDFGIAKIQGGDGEALTREGAICGTPAFMSPEQVVGKAVTPRSDIFSLGSVAYYMLTGKLPFSGKSSVDMAGAILLTNPTPPSRARLDANISSLLESICMRALSKESSQRFQSATEMCDALTAAIEQLKSGVNQVSVKKSVIVGGGSGYDGHFQTQAVNKKEIMLSDDDGYPEYLFMTRYKRRQIIFYALLTLIVILFLGVISLFIFIDKIPGIREVQPVEREWVQ